MEKRFSDRALINSSLILGGCVIVAALITSPANPFAPITRIMSSAFDATFAKDYIERKFIAQMTKEVQRKPKADIAPNSRLQSVTVNKISSGSKPGGTRGIKIDYTLTFYPSGTYNYTAYVRKTSQGSYTGLAEYGIIRGPKSSGYQYARITIK